MKQVNQQRREALRQGGALGIFGLFVNAGLVSPSHAQGAWNQPAFTAKGVADVVKGLGGSTPAPTKDVSWGSTPEIAENGAVVPIAVESKIPKTESISILVEKNPSSLTASFTIPPGTDPNVSTRVKMGETSMVHALIKADGKYYVASREIKVTLGGCGG
jgi:sulfur-oxidizing protein SoxY